MQIFLSIFDFIVVYSVHYALKVKYCGSDFVILETPISPPPVRAHTLLTDTPSP